MHTHIHIHATWCDILSFVTLLQVSPFCLMAILWQHNNNGDDMGNIDIAIDNNSNTTTSTSIWQLRDNYNCNCCRMCMQCFCSLLLFLLYLTTIAIIFVCAAVGLAAQCLYIYLICNVLFSIRYFFQFIIQCFFCFNKSLFSKETKKPSINTMPNNENLLLLKAHFHQMPLLMKCLIFLLCTSVFAAIVVIFSGHWLVSV